MVMYRSSPIGVDSFFTLSGCLLAQGFLRMHAENKKINLLNMLLKRYLR